MTRTPTIRLLLILSAVFTLLAPYSLLAEDEDDLYSFDVESFEKKVWEWQGEFNSYLRLKTLNNDTALYAIKFPGASTSQAIDFAATLTLDSRWDFDWSRIILSGEVSLTRSSVSTFNADTVFIGEAYWEYLDAEPHLFSMGKILSRWGKGYAFNPVALMEKPKNPEDPDASREGLWLASGMWILGQASFLDAISISAVVLPVNSSLNSDYRSSITYDNLLGMRFYGLISVTDIDLYWVNRLKAKESDFGVDFAANINPAFEIHGEWASLNQSGTSSQQLLLGLRYLTESEVTWIAELFHNSSGMSADDITNMFQTIRTSSPSSVTSYLSLIQKSKVYGKNYGYVKASFKEPLDILYFTPSISWFINLDDSSFNQAIQMAYTPTDNWTLSGTWQHFLGATNTQFGESVISDKLEISANYCF